MRTNEDGSITLSERNLRALLAKVDILHSCRALEGGTDAPGVVIRCELDEEHYTDRLPGPMADWTEKRIHEQSAR